MTERAAPRSPGSALDLGDAWVIVELAPDAVLVVDEGGAILLANRAAEEMFGYGREELARLDVEALVPEGRRGAHLSHRSGFHASPRTRPMALDLDLWARRADGSEVPVQISLSPLTFGQGQFVVAIVREVTAHRAAEQAIREHLVLADEERIGAQLRDTVISRLFAAGIGVETVLNDVRPQVARQLVNVIDELDGAIRELREIIFRRPPSFDEGKESNE